MIDEIAALVNQYLVWLKDKTALRQIDDYVEITTPFLDRHNDYIQIYVKLENNNYIITDAGYTIQDLELSGCSLESGKRQNLLKMTLAGFGVRNDSGALNVYANKNDFPLRKHNLIQAILAINDLFYMAKPYIASVFFEDVEAWLELKEIRNIPKPKFTGKSGYDHLFDFVIPKSKLASERIVQVINNPTKDAALSLDFAWDDTRDSRPPNSKAYAILNDSKSAISSSILVALRNYDIVPISWSEKEDAYPELAA